MAGIQILTFSTPTTIPRVSPRSLHVAPPPPPTRSVTISSRKQTRRRGSRVVVIRAGGPSTSTYVFAFLLPFSLLGATIFTSLKISDKLDKDFLRELAIDEAIRAAEEGDGDDEDGDEDDPADVISDEEEVLQPVVPVKRTRNRPKREV